MDERFLRAWFSRPRRVLERELKPFSLAHRLVLEAIGSPLVAGGAPFTMADLLVAVRICSAADPFAPLPAPTWLDRVRFWRGSFAPAWFRRQSEAFVAYMDDHASLPRFWQRSGEFTAKESVPWTLEIASALLRHTSLSERAVWMMPIGRAFWYYTALRRQEGADVEVLTTEEEALLDELARDIAQ